MLNFSTMPRSAANYYLERFSRIDSVVFTRGGVLEALTQMKLLQRRLRTDAGMRDYIVQTRPIESAHHTKNVWRVGEGEPMRISAGNA